MRKSLFQALLILIVISFSAPAVWAKPENYKVDPQHSFVIFRTKHLDLGWVFGRFRELRGSIKFDEKSPKNSQLNVTVRAKSVYTGVRRRDKHLRSADFLNAKKFPTITFQSTSIKATNKENVYQMVGKLKLHGVEKEIKTNFTVVGKGKGMQGEVRIGGIARFVINREEFGMTALRKVAGNKIYMTISLEGVKQ